MNIKQMVESGHAITKIANKLNIPIIRVKQEIKENNYVLINELFDNSKIDYICELYKEGVSAKQLGKKYNIDKRRVLRWAKEKGSIRTISESLRTTFFNEHKMDIINDPAKAYWLGMCIADAYNADMISTFSLILKGSDIDHVKKFARFLSYPEDKADRNINKEKNTDTANIKLYSKYFCSKMTELGCPRAKSFIVKYPEWLDSNLDNHFIRGLFDGDGCLTFRAKQKEWKWNLAGTKEICAGVSDKIFNNIGIRVKFDCISKTNNNTYCLSVGGNVQINEIMNWLYVGANKEIWLDRKYEKYQQLCKQQKDRKVIRAGNRINSNV